MQKKDLFIDGCSRPHSSLFFFFLRDALNGYVPRVPVSSVTVL